jgi:hypothetical protein
MVVLVPVAMVVVPAARVVGMGLGVSMSVVVRVAMRVAP